MNVRAATPHEIQNLQQQLESSPKSLSNEMTWLTIALQLTISLDVQVLWRRWSS